MRKTKHPSFLATVISHLNQSDRVGERLLVFPTWLSIDYFESLFGREKWQEHVSCVTLDALMLRHSHIQLLPTLSLLKRLHPLAEQIFDSNQSFEQFYSWGLIVLNDFNEIDSHLINGAQVFLSLADQKQLTAHSLIDQTLSKSFKKVRAPSLCGGNDLLFWQKLPLLYRAFREKLLEQGVGYLGLCHRMAQPLPDIMATYQELTFIGFNELTPAQEQFISCCHSAVPTTFFWDADSHYLDNDINLAGYYLREHRKKKWCPQPFPKVTYFNDPDKKVLLTEVSTPVAEVQVVIAALQEQTSDGQPKFLPNQTAIVVSGSDLLIPLLDQLDALFISLHCRLDYPFNATVIYSIVVRLVQLWEASTRIEKQQEMGSHMEAVLALASPFIEKKWHTQLAVICQSLEKDTPLLPCLRQTLSHIYTHFIEMDGLFLALHKNGLLHLLAYIDTLMGEMANCSADFFLNGLKGSKMLFEQHNPLTGLSIVEVTQSYNLDFENIFFLNMNEGYFPQPMHHDSLLPYDLRAGFGLPLVDKVAENRVAYGFYRLLQRSQNIYCLYAQKNNLDSGSEMSRLLLQLTFDSKLKMIEAHRLIHSIKRAMAPISIEKDEAVMRLLDRFLVKESATGSALTPSACITYLSCPLQFYFTYLLQLKQTVSSKKSTESLQLGTLFHHAMANLYGPFVGKQVGKENVTALKSKIKPTIEEAMARQKKPPSSPLLLHALLEKLLERMLDLDHADAPFTLLGVERSIKHFMVLEGATDLTKQKVWLGGVIDRIDRHKDAIRIVDYKTGLAHEKIANVAELFDSAKVKKNKAMFQLLFYGWLFKKVDKVDNPQPIIPYLLSIRSFFSTDYKPGIFIQQQGNGKKYQRIEDMMAYTQPFEKELSRLLVEIFNPAIPFVQTNEAETCANCPYVRICQRD